MQNDDLLANVTEVAGSKVLPPCVVMNRLGRGGMGAVYRARHLNLAIDVAVKVLKPQLVADDPQFVARFKREGQSAAAISHQNVIRVFDVAEHGGLHYIIMELVVGENARDRVQRKGQLPLGEALQILHDAAQGLGAAHALGIVHRDVKPDNLLISTTGQLKVADLGLAKPTLGGGGASLMSAANQVMGTPSYMPPEQWESPAVGPAADVWALGATLWFLLVGEEAFDSRDGNFPRVMKQIVLQPFPDLKKRRPDVPDAVVAVLAKATAKDPKDRYPDAGELAAAIDALDLPRVSLRDRTQTTEAQTMVSPSPKNLDQIKQWLREDNLTRLQTPRSQAAAAAVITAAGASGAAGLTKGGGSERGPDSATMPSGPRPELAGKSPSTVSGYEPPQVKRSRRGVWAAVAVLAVGGAIAGYMVSQPNDDPGSVPIGKVDPDAGGKTNGDATGSGEEKPPAPKPEPEPPPNPVPAPAPAAAPFALVEQFEKEEKFAEAIAEYENVVAAKTASPEPQRLARLLARDGEQLAAKEQFGAALRQVQRAVEIDREGFAAAQEGVLAVVRTAVGLKVFKPLLDATPLGQDVGFVATVNENRIRKLLVNDQEANAASAVSYNAAIPGNPAELVIRAELLDGTVVDLDQRRVLYSQRAALTFPVAIAPARGKSMSIEDIAYTTLPELVIAGRVSTPDAEILCNDAPVRVVTFETDGSFTASIPLGADGELNALRIRARKEGFDDSPVVDLRAVSLRTKTTIGVQAPRETEEMSCPVTVTTVADYGVVRVTARVGERSFALQRDPANRNRWLGNAPLAPGNNTVEAIAVDFNERKSSDSFVVKCTITPPRITEIVLGVDGREQTPPSGATVPVPAGVLTLRAKTASPRMKLQLGNRDVASGTNVEVGDLADGKSATFTFTASNEMPNRSDSWSVTIVRDTTKPKAEVDAITTISVPADKPLTLTGSWRDAGGLGSLTVDDQRGLLATDAVEGRWGVTLPAPGRDRTYTLVARDRAGNQVELPIPVTVAKPSTEAPQPQPRPDPAKPEPPKPNPTAAQAPLTFPGFTSDPATTVNDLGYPKKIVDTQTGIELIAVPFAAGKKPTLYVARTPVTEKQYAGEGTNNPQVDVTGNNVSSWLKDKPRFELLTVDEWKTISTNPDLDLRPSLVEWLKPEGVAASNWPVVKDADARATYPRGTSRSSLGFRVKFRVP